jgi:hypothetical protein
LAVTFLDVDDSLAEEEKFEPPVIPGRASAGNVEREPAPKGEEGSSELEIKG